MCEKYLTLPFCLVLLLPCWAVAQELVYDAPIKVGYDSVDCWTPYVIFNGAGHGVFYYWSGVGDKDQGLHFRRLDENARPVGPQVQVIDGSYGYTAGTWDGEAYLVTYMPRYSTKVYLLRVSPTGKLLAQQTIAKERKRYIGNAGIFVIGEKVFWFFQKEQKVGWYFYDAYLGQVDRKLTKPIRIRKIPVGGFKNSLICGVTHDTDKFLIMLGEFSTDMWGSFYKVVKVSLLQMDFAGRVIKQSQSVPAIQDVVNRTPYPAIGISDLFLDSWTVAGPVNVGDGYIIVASRAPDPERDGSSLPYGNQSYKIDEDGSLLGGPYKLAGQSGNYGSGRLVGNHAAFWALDWTISRDSFLMLIGKKGAHIGNSYYGEIQGPNDLTIVSTHAYTGMANTIAYLLWQDYWLGPGFIQERIYANQYRMPEFSKPGFFYFKAGTAEPVKNHRLVMWSVVLGKNVTLKGPDFELKDLPPVWSYLVDTKGQKTKLTLSFTTEYGQTKKKRLVINP